MRSYSAPQVIQRETIIHHEDSGSSFWNQMMFWHMMSEPRTPVVIAPGVVNSGVVGQGAVVEPVVIQQGHSIFFYLFWMVILGFVVWCAVKAVRSLE